MTSSKQLPPTSRKPQGLGGWENEDLTQLAAWPQLVKYQLRETTRSHGYHDPLERFTPLPVGGANAANKP